MSRVGGMLEDTPEVAAPGGKAQGKVVKLIYQSYLVYQGRYPRVSGQAKILKERGFDITVLACDRDAKHPTQEVLEGIPVVRIPVKTGENRGPLSQLLPLILFYVRAWRWLKKHDFDVLHCHNLDVLPIGWWVRLRKRVAVVFDAHEPNYYALWPGKWQFMLHIVNGVERWFSKRLDGISVTNEYQVEKFNAMGARRVALMGNYPIPSLRREQLLEEKFSRPTVTFGRMGTIYKNSGYEESLAAISAVIEKSDACEFLLAGRVVDNYQADFDQAIEPFRDRVQRVGAFPAEHMPELYDRIDVSLLIYPKSNWFREITPRKFFDSLANGVPVIMTDIGRLGAVIQKHEIGYVVDENDVEGIVQAMLDFAGNEEKRRRMSENALRLAQTEFSWERMADKYVSYQQDLIASCSGSR